MSIQTKHTPGPWSIVDARGRNVERITIAQIAGHIRPADSPVVCRIENTVSGKPLGQDDEANASLIAAAPDLLQACKNAAAALNCALAYLNDVTDNGVLDLHPAFPLLPKIEATEKAIQQSISKAEGNQ